MADSEEVMKQILTSRPPAGVRIPEIIGIVVNEQGIERALATPGVTTIGYPYSISAYFRRANANMTRAESRALVEQLRKATKAAGHGLVVYISMAFGNPYDEPWGPGNCRGHARLAEGHRRAHRLARRYRREPPLPNRSARSIAP